MKAKMVFCALVVCLMLAFASGSEWVRRYSSTFGDAAATGIALSPVGTPYITGYTTDSLYAQIMLTIKYNPNSGDSVVQTYEVLSDEEAPDAGSALAVSTAGNVFVTGYCTNKVRYQ